MDYASLTDKMASWVDRVVAVAERLAPHADATVRGMAEELHNVASEISATHTQATNVGAVSVENRGTPRTSEANTVVKTDVGEVAAERVADHSGTLDQSRTVTAPGTINPGVPAGADPKP